MTERDTRPFTLNAIADLVYEALRFANFAAGEGICPANEDDARDPALFLSDYTDQTGDDDWDAFAGNIRDQLAALLREAGEIKERAVAQDAGATDKCSYERGMTDGRAFAASVIAEAFKSFRLGVNGMMDGIDVAVADIGRPVPVASIREGRLARPLPAPPATGGKDGQG